MPISLSEARAQLLKGTPLSWTKFENNKAGSIALNSPGARRLFKFLVEQSPSKVAEANEVLFPGLIAAWEAGDDPAASTKIETDVAPGGIWRLVRIEAKNFAGLTTWDGPSFDMSIGGENWCLEGQNGSGKTSLSNAILWAMTGKRVREQDGLVDELGERSAVNSPAGKEIGSWPSIVSYPKTVAQLAQEAVAWVRLTFENEKAEKALAERKLTSPKEGTASIEVSVDARLTTIPQLIETGLLMPARIPRIGFGDKSQSLYEAVKLLTGLDQLGDIADGVAKLANKAQRFYKYAKDQGVEAIVGSFTTNLEKAEVYARNLAIDLSSLRTLGEQDHHKLLLEAAKSAAAQAAAHIATLKSEIADDMDTSVAAVRMRIKQAVENARAITQLGVNGIVQFEAWISLKEALEDEGFKSIPAALEDAKKKLEEAVYWHERQREDTRLRLKALAAQYFVEPEGDALVVCPLCEGQLTSEQQRGLAAELARLREHASVAERKIDDACGAIDRELKALLTPDIRKHFDLLRVMVPKSAYADAVRSRFGMNDAFSDVLTGITKLTGEIVDEQVAALPDFVPSAMETLSQDTPRSVLALRQTIHSLKVVSDLAFWWEGNASAFRAAWAQLIGKMADKDDPPPLRSITGKLRILEQAIEKAEPLDQLAGCLQTAADAVEKWENIQKHQRVREAIIEALEPLKDLKHLVGAETARSIATLSDRIRAILDKIRLNERFLFQDAALDRKTIKVEGSFEPGLQIDALLVANTSWLRAILWAFVFALREETIEAAGSNPLPLVLLDDPQVTFDPRNERKWAQEIARLANAGSADSFGMQLILTTHERQFVKFLVDENLLKGQQGLVSPLNKASPVATIVNGTNVDQLYDKAAADNDDGVARQFIAAVRVYSEDLLKCMMRAESVEIADMSLDALRGELKRLREAHVAPFNRQVFKELVGMLMGGGGKEMNIINEAHHKDNETLGLAQAVDVKRFWDKQLRPKLHEAFHVYAQFEAFAGEPRMFGWSENVIGFPAGHNEALKALTLMKTGVAAAAKSNGKAGDGIVTLKEWDDAEPVRLFNHEIYQLAAATLDPVAGIGDVLIVSNYAPITKHSLVVAAFGEQLLARRHSETDLHPTMTILTGQTLEPHQLPQPVIAPNEKLQQKKIVGTLFVSHVASPPSHIDNCEIVAVNDVGLVQKALSNVRLFQVRGRSAEPIALDGQYLATHATTFGSETLKRMEGRLVVAVDETGERYFKRLRLHGSLVVLESLNPDGTTAAQLLSLDGSHGLPKLTNLLEVVGVLFELPDQAKKGS
ncbi:AAA family ATPase [Bradyrhizobium acaciae]|uniref:AAA family ATPase n=1 Tax=Bradyrhizobium acaciae TaxID=2683706 RepID=UPI001E2E0B43|nr:AAA family ATPase [Bradyrhizobium acaciae]MCC8978556.1 AAA family ATPase [Bradyrhizobium acaciae]